ncbi:MAG: ATP-binding protein, partial [Candidatus Woesearchaeota archaeon]
YCGFLVLDPHDEYYGRNKLGLKDHPSSNKLIYYTSSFPPPGARSLKINIKLLRPHHFISALNWSDPQIDAMYSYYKYKGEDWLLNILLGYKLDAVVINEMTIDVVKRRLMNLLGIKQFGTKFECNGVFDFHSGETTIKEVANELEKGNTVVIDTSSFSGTIELLVGGLFVTEIFDRYKRYKMNGELDDKPVISVVLEEAPRVLGKDVLEHGSNVFDQIAREGRKFKIGLVAITQIPSLIPRAILANMNTKIILGIEMAPERNAIIDSASQDLSKDDRAIASLDKGEAIITSNFARFAMPIKIPLFENIAKRNATKQPKKIFVAIKQ